MRTPIIRFALALAVAWSGFLCLPAIRAQESPGGEAIPTTPDAGISQQELQQLAAEASANRNSPAAPEPNAGLKNSLNFLSLLIQGGTLMIPIGIMSLLVVAVGLERMIALRRGRLFPGGLRRELRRAIENGGPLAPKELFESSQRHPSAASRIMQDMLQKIGRPIPEAEAAINEGTQREADYLYSNVRWLSLAAAVTPLIGLLGTVWGMIIAFYNTTQLGAGRNRAEVLAEGIYVALVTTLGGLAVAIPAAILAHYFEGKITKMLASIDWELRRLIPRFESLEGKTRYDISSQGLTRREASEHNSKRRSANADANKTQVSPARPTAPRS